ncbi:MAG TPA: hypothetical protein VNK43_01880 [Gemmatimonadales bacterium]|nr:hypothetical protein [Gemmatimonadales bacterium]
MDPFTADVIGVTVVVSGLLLATLVVGLGPIGRALARRIEGRGVAESRLEELLARLEARLGDVERAHDRLAEVEERLDFAERLLARSPGPERGSEGRDR